MRIILGAFSVGLLVLTLATALFGTTVELLNFAPTFVYVTFWLGIPLLSVLLGNVWSVLSPWRALADATVWLLERGGREARPVLEWTGRLGATRQRSRSSRSSRSSSRIRARRTRERSRSRRALQVLGARRDGDLRTRRVDALRRGLRGRVRALRADRAVRGARRARWSSAGRSPASPGPDRTRGALVFVAVMLGSTSFDGFSGRACGGPPDELRAGASPTRSSCVIDLDDDVVNLVGLARHRRGRGRPLTYTAARRGARPVHALVSLVPDFVLPLVPIAVRVPGRPLLLALRDPGQFIIPFASDPFGRGWDLFGTIDYAPNLAIVSPETVWYVQVVALTVGHVAGLAIAHDRAVALFESRSDALRSQYPMLALMVLYTVGGLWLLSQR